MPDAELIEAIHRKFTAVLIDLDERGTRRLPKQAYDLLCTASLLDQRTLSSPTRAARILSQKLAQDSGRGSNLPAKHARGLKAISQSDLKTARAWAIKEEFNWF